MSSPNRKPHTIAVLFGGFGSEREVSLQSGKMVLEHLPEPFVAVGYDPKIDLERFIADAKSGKFDVVFNALHGLHGEDGAIQGLLEILGVPYTGSGVLASALAMNKSMAKRLFLAAGIPTAPAMMVTARGWKSDRMGILDSVRSRVGQSVVVKPNSSGSSLGVTINPKPSEIEAAIDLALKEDGTACLVELFRKGRELTVGVIGNQDLSALPVVEIRPKAAFYDFHAKYVSDETGYVCPADLPPNITEEAQALATACHIALGCRGASRTDMIWHEQGIDVLETNTLPGMTSHSLLPKAAAATGLTFPNLLVRLIELATEPRI